MKPTPYLYYGKANYTLEPEGQEPMQHSLQPRVDQEARWVKKEGQLQ